MSACRLDNRVAGAMSRVRRVTPVGGPAAVRANLQDGLAWRGSRPKRMRGIVVSNCVTEYLCCRCLLSATALAPLGASAETISGALAKAYQQQFGAEFGPRRRARHRRGRGDRQVGLSADDRRAAATSTIAIRTSSIGNAATASPPARSASQIQQMLFDGFQTTNNVAAAEAQVQGLRSRACATPSRTPCSTRQAPIWTSSATGRSPC